MEYLLHNKPLNWLVGPFAPQLIEKAEDNGVMEGPASTTGLNNQCGAD